MKKIVITGGGTAGHVTPALALIPKLNDLNYEIYYIGGNGIEKEILKNYPNIKFYEITCEKLRRSLSLKNFLIPFKVYKGYRQSKKILQQIKPNIIFSKGGYVAYPVVKAADKLNIPIIAHESDMSMGLSNKLIYKHTKVMCFSFEKPAKNYEKGVFTGTPIRKSIAHGNKYNVRTLLGITNHNPTILVFGGSLGAKAINQTIRQSLSMLNNYNIIHIVGKGNIDNDLLHKKNYHQIEFVNNIEDYFACCDFVISRAGSNSINELLYIQKPMILIPLPQKNSRGDQIENANYFKECGYCSVLYQENMSPTTLVAAINEMHNYKFKYISKMQKVEKINAVDKICDIIQKYSL